MGDDGLTRRQFLKAGLGVLAGAVAIPAVNPLSPHLAVGDGGQGDAWVRPNLVYILSDQLRACSIGCYGNEEISTPRMDELAAQGARFTNAVSTSPQCTPHRACLMTGRYPTATGVVENDLKLPAEELSIAEVLNRAGYLTHYIGKWHLNGPTPNPNADPGWVSHKDRQGFTRWTAFNLAHLYYGGHYYSGLDRNMRTIPPGTYEPDFQTAQVIDFIAANRSQRFCLFLSPGTPHPGSGADLPPGGNYHFPYDPGSLTLRPNVDYPDLDYARQEYADYYGIVSNLDWNVGRILHALDALGLANNTIVVVTADHGDYLGSHFGRIGQFRGKTRIEAESLDVPFILRYPEVVAPQAAAGLFTSVDIMPTLLGLCRVPVPAGVMGRNFGPLLAGRGQPVEPPWGPVPSKKSALVGMWWETSPWVGVRTARFTLHCDGVMVVPTQLYDNVLDPFQMANLVDDPDYRPVKDYLLADLISWLAYVDAQRS